MTTRTPRDHHVERIAYANGYDIEMRKKGGNWFDAEVFDAEPDWSDVDYEFRVKPEREYPVTSLTRDDLTDIYIKSSNLIDVANAAIKRYIEDNQINEIDKLK